MAKTTKAKWIIAGPILFLYIILLVAWVLKLLPERVLSGCGWILAGLAWLPYKMFGSLPRWPQLLTGVGICLQGVGSVGIGVGSDTLFDVSMLLGSLMFLVGLVALARYAQNPDPRLPLVLADWARAKAGLPDMTDEQGPVLQVVLVDAGPHPNKVGGRLIRLYDIAGTPQLKSILRLAPVAIQTTTSRREADFVAAQLSACGAQVDIRRASD